MTALRLGRRTRPADRTIGLGRAVLSRLTDGTPWTVLCVSTDRPLSWLLARDAYGSVAELRGRGIGIHAPATAPGCFARIACEGTVSIPNAAGHSSQHLKSVPR